MLISTSLIIFSGTGSTLLPVTLLGGVTFSGVLDYLLFSNSLQNVTTALEPSYNLALNFFWGFNNQEYPLLVSLVGEVTLVSVGSSLVMVSSVTEAIKSLFMFLLILVINFYLFSINNLVRSFGRLFSFLKNSLTTNLPFLNFFDLIVIFIFFFMSVYFLEIHFFFVFIFNGASDSTNYQFNFLLSSFFFVFVFKTLFGIYSQSLLFSVSSFNQTFFNFYSGIFFKIDLKKKKVDTRAHLGRSHYFIFIGKFTFHFFLNSFFFLSTFLVWFLRFCIQFVRLLVLFIVHTVFEFIVIGSDFYFSNINSIGFFIFKSFFLFFFYFCGFLYLIVYLNLMFTLQIFIFYFFSEIFQSNFIFDLSAISISKLKK